MEVNETEIPKVKERKDLNPKEPIKSKTVEQLDPFFQEAMDQPVVNVEKRAVMRDGRIPKMQKNLEKERKEAALRQAKQEGWLREKAKQEEEKKRAERAKKPMKIRAGAYGAGLAVDKTIIHESGNKDSKRNHIFF